MGPDVEQDSLRRAAPAGLCLPGGGDGVPAMVFTVRMRNPVTPSRRAVLATGVAVGSVAAFGGPVLLSGCALLDRAPVFQPGRNVLDDIREDALALAAQYEALMSARPELADRLAPMRDAHRAHVSVIGQELGRSSAPPGTSRLPAPRTSGSSAGASSAGPTPSASGPPPTAGSLVSLVALERAGAEHAAAACLTVPAWRAPLVGAIAACRASHVEALA